jgi:hypothetical protein
MREYNFRINFTLNRKALYFMLKEQYLICSRDSIRLQSLFPGQRLSRLSSHTIKSLGSFRTAE